MEGRRRSPRWRRGLALAGGAVLLAAGVVAATPQPAGAAPGCTVTYQAQPWSEGPSSGGFTASVTVTNTGDPISGWTLSFALPAGQTFTQGWSATWSPGPPVSATGLDWNRDLATGASTTMGFNGRWTGSYADPTAFTLNGTTCNGGGGPGPTPSVSLSPATLTVGEGTSGTLTARLSAAPAAGTTVNVGLAAAGDGSITVSPAQVGLTSANWQSGVPVTVSAAQDADTTDGSATITASASGYTPGSATVTEDDDDGGGPTPNKVDNPFAGATGYVNPAWQGQVDTAADAAGGTLGAQMRVVGRQPTAVWMDRIGAIDPSGSAMGLADHLDAAVQQDAANGTAPVVISVVIYDLPNRDCAALASNGELLIAQNGLARYRTEYIDPIRQVMADPAYANLRLALIVEPDSLPNLVTNTSGAQASQRCIEAQQTGAYRDGVRYAVSQLGSLANTYLYVDIAHSGWLGWPTNFDGVLQVYDQVFATGQGGPGYDKLHGFITNTANYTPLEEPFLPNPNLQVGSGQVMSSTFYEFNPRFDERDFATDLRAAFAQRGCTGCGMLIDTSRNGWGGPGRPTQVSTSTDLNTYVDQSRVDRRPHRGGWCNQAGAGIGMRPTASTGIAGVDAFVWVKPPGESDGVSQPGIVDPDDPSKGFDAMCDPDAQNRYDAQFPTNALPGAPHAGRWFPAQFTMLVQNAFPALPTS
jgi:cellulose 1,4-beta-cellobiosidase